MDGLWKESSERKIHWQDWTVGAVEKFIDWLYTGDYVCPYPIEARKDESAPAGSAGDDKNDADRAVRSDISESGVMEPAEPGTVAVEDPVDALPPEAGWSNWQDGEILRDIEPRPLTRLQDLDWQGCRPLGKMSQAEEFDKWSSRRHWEPEELDYEATFLTHAELYAMANQYMLDELKSMAWQRLRAVLVSIGKPKPWSPVVDNTVALIKYACEHTGGVDDSEEPLRMLLSSFVALHFTSFKGYEVDGLMLSKEEAHREFVLGLLGKVTQQMTYLEMNEESNLGNISSSYREIRGKKKGKKGHTSGWQ